MFTMRRLIIVATAAALMTGCASQNPYDNQGQAQGSTGMSKTAKYGGLGALAGAIAGGVIGHTIEGRRLGEREVYQFHVRLDDGRWATVTQRDNPGLRQGSRVLLHDDRLSAIR